MIDRLEYKELNELLTYNPVVAVLGARQIGKTTLAKKQASKLGGKSIYLDLELDSHYSILENDAESYLSQHQDKLVIIDEIQRMPRLFALIRALVDMKRKPGRFLLLGSSSPHLIKGVSESLAGRIAYLNLGGINMAEAMKNKIKMENLWFKGGFPVPLTMKKPAHCQTWYLELIRSYAEKDMRELFGVEFSSVTIRNFWSMLAHNNGSIWNKESYSKSLNVTAPTVGRYLEYMEAAYLVTRLQAWSGNSKKRLVKAPKIYIRDTGILHTLLKVHSMDELLGHPQAGYSWEAFVVEQILQLKHSNVDAYFYRSHQGTEADVVLVKGNKPLACIEIKSSATPTLTKGFHQSVADLKTKHNFIVIPKGENYTTKENFRICTLVDFLKNHLHTIK